MRSGCQPLRHSSPIVGFCVQRIGVARKSPVTQILQPMHSRMSSIRPSSTFFGRNGSAIEGRAAPMRSSAPDLIKRHHRIGRGVASDPHDGFGRHFLDEGHVAVLKPARREARGHAVIGPVADVHVPEVRDLGQHLDHVAALALRAEAVRHPEARPLRTAGRCRRCRRRRPWFPPSTSRRSRTRFSRLPPYSSVRWFQRRDRKCDRAFRSCPA